MWGGTPLEWIAERMAVIGAMTGMGMLSFIGILYLSLMLRIRVMRDAGREAGGMSGEEGS